MALTTSKRDHAPNAEVRLHGRAYARIIPLQGSRIINTLERVSKEPTAAIVLAPAPCNLGNHNESDDDSDDFIDSGLLDYGNDGGMYADINDDANLLLAPTVATQASSHACLPCACGSRHNRQGLQRQQPSLNVHLKISTKSLPHCRKSLSNSNCRVVSTELLGVDFRALLTPPHSVYYSFHGNPAHMRKLCKEAMAAAGEYGRPTFMITMTANEYWLEVVAGGCTFDVLFEWKS